MSTVAGKWWHVDVRPEEANGDREGRIVCDLCPRQCRMKEGDRGFCFVRKVEHGAMVLDTYGKSTGFCIDPVEKKPLNHFFPGTSVLSFGTAGCNLGCQFCQNWDISKSREVAKLSEQATPEAIARAAKTLGCRSVAFTYNDPVIWAEYAIDTAKACRELGVATIAVTAGYMMPEPRREFYQWMDAANVDLKAFTEDFYRHITYSHLEPVLETLRYLKHETDVWFEITNLVIPGANDSSDELKRMCDWIVRELGTDVPIHFSAFHPDFRMRDRGNTPPEKLVEAFNLAKQAGIRYPFVGNVHDPKHSSTYCHVCDALLIERDWYELGIYAVDHSRCKACGTEVAGRFDEGCGNWGRKRLPIDMSRFADPIRNAQSPASVLPSKPSSAEPTSCAVNSPEKLVRLGGSSSISSNHGVSLSIPNAAPSIQVRSPSLRTGINPPNADHPTNTDRVTGTDLGKKESPVSQPSISEPVKLDLLRFEHLSTDQKSSIQRVAQVIAISTVLKNRLPSTLMNTLGELGDQIVHGCFTTLKRGKLLRGCCGFLGRPTPLNQAILESAQRTAKDDPRMPAISSVELPFLSCHLTLLAPAIAIDGPAEERAQQIEIGKHGLRISSGPRSPFGERAGLLLPSVPVEQGWNVGEYLAGICRKAGLPANAWQDQNTRLETFEGLEIEGHFDADLLPNPIPTERAPGDLESLFQLKSAAIQNMIALSHGSTPNYYVLGAMDGNVNGIVMSAVNLDSQRPLAHWIQTSLRPGMPLQATLFELVKSAEQSIRRANFKKSVDIDLALTILHDTAHHGVIHPGDWNGNQLREDLSDCDLRGIVSKERAILALSGDRAAVAFDADKSIHRLVEEAAGIIKTRSNPIGIFSLGCVSTANSLLATNRVGIDPSDQPRPPAIAGQFYPSEASELEAMLQAFESKSSIGPDTKTLAIMTPHAGLKYSGQIAMDAWRSAGVSKTVIIIGPKHTNLGAEWAVSPSKSWQLPNGDEFAVDMELASQIVKHVSGMEFDAAAHSREHGVEVQLPILSYVHRTSQKPKIVPIAMANSSWQDIATAAKQLAEVIRGCEEYPLLVISSDMNHFGSDEENRRLDELALAALASGNPERLLETCQSNSISMCGVVPAALVMQTLIELNETFGVERLGYDTSASTTGDTSRVVGYAACRFVR
ncbi:MAG: AmmeMemoRadiSam system radical SAM enzyme [Pirellula sp.]